MSNIVKVEFRKSPPKAKPKAPQKRKGKTAAVPPDDYYFVSMVQRAADVAALVYRDMEATDLLLAEIRKMYARGDGQGYLPIDVRARCAQYLSSGEQSLLDTSKAIQIMLGDPAR